MTTYLFPNLFWQTIYAQKTALNAATSCWNKLPTPYKNMAAKNQQQLSKTRHRHLLLSMRCVNTAAIFLFYVCECVLCDLLSVNNYYFIALKQRHLLSRNCCHFGYRTVGQCPPCTVMAFNISMNCVFVWLLTTFTFVMFVVFHRYLENRAYIDPRSMTPERSWISMRRITLLKSAINYL